MKKSTRKIGILSAAAVAFAGCGGGGGAGTTGNNSGGGGGSTTNSAPMINGTATSIVRANEAYTFTPQASDADDDALTFEVENVPDWAVFYGSTGELSGTPTPADLGPYERITITVSDGVATSTLEPFAVTVLPGKLNESNFTADGTIVSTANGYQSIGNLVVNNGIFVQEFKNSDLTLDFDANGELVDFAGETTVPFVLSSTGSETLTGEADADVRAVVSMMSGAEINADETFGIKLIDENDYFVYYIGGAMTLNFANADDPSRDRTFTVEPPVGSEWLLITDINDPFYYYYAHVPILPLIPAYGEGRSFNSLIPFEPLIDFEELDSFNGTNIENGIVTIGNKLFDFFEVSGVRVLKKSTLFDIDWTDPFNSPYEFRAGVNGEGAIILSVLGVGFFEMDYSQVSATLDVGLDRQHLAMAQIIAPDVSWQPDWFHVLPTTETRGEWSIDGYGEFHVSLSSSFESLVPVGDIAGEMTLSNEGAAFAGSTTAAGEPLVVSLEFLNEQTIGRVEFPEIYATSIKSDVSDALDRELQEVERRMADLENALAQVDDLELNLNNIRLAIPEIVDKSIATLNGIPGIVGLRVYEGVIDGFRTSCGTAFGITKCADDFANEYYYATLAAGTAQNEAQAAVNAQVVNLVALKAAASAADDDALRESLRQALLSVYDNRNFLLNIDFSQPVTLEFDAKVYTFKKTVTVRYKQTYTRAILDAATANRVKTAADNIHLLQETGGIVISLQAVLEQLPTADVINEVKEQVNAGITAVPIPDGLGYRAYGNSYTAFVTVDGVDHDVDFNVLNPSDVKDGVSELLGELLLQ